MKIADMKVTELINEVGAGTPAPGGGAVAGLAGGVGVALTMMVNGLTLDKKGFENDRERLLDAIAKGNELKERFIDVMNRDSEVFDVLIESLALPKDDDEHKAIRRGAVQASFRNCTLVPLTMMEICSEAIDLCAGLVGGLGFAPSANIGDTTRIYEAVHGSAPDIAGQDKANPSAILMAFAMMLGDLGETEKAARLNAAILAQVAEGKVVTADIGGTAGTKEFTQAVIDRL